VEPTLSKAKWAKTINALGRKDHDDVIAYCRDPEKFPEGDVKSLYTKAISAGESSFGVSGALMTEAFAAFYPTQVVKNNAGDDVNMFEYIMRAQTFAFPFSQEQAVLNAYFGDLKSVREKSTEKFNPTTKNECTKYRERRGMRDNPATNHCDPEQIRLRPYYSIGR